MTSRQIVATKFIKIKPPMLTARRSYASAVLRVVILSDFPSVCLSHAQHAACGPACSCRWKRSFKLGDKIEIGLINKEPSALWCWYL